ncbi:MAG: PEGA domain-containing protein [Candidatus Aminicenantes bacterium]|nr:PEGA domain-containing protein [Candidatus Aminicenantes bacterium]MBL7083134.1 PEGA domain-containing protein [Candidatus Aminicenantes bacterium]
MELTKPYRRIVLLSIFLVFFLVISLGAAPIRVKVTVDDAKINETRAIGGKTLARVPLNTVLDAETKQGEWYKVTWQGVSGYMHEMLVEEVSESVLAQPEIGPSGVATKTQPTIIAEIQVKMNESRSLIRQEKDYDKAISTLRPLVARIFTVIDNAKQKQLAAEVYLWIGYSYASQGNALSALSEFRNMFEVDYAYAKANIRNIFDTKISSLIQQSENAYKGLVIEYSLEISTVPKEAVIKIDGKEIGLSPEIYSTSSPEIVIEIEKKGYKPIREELFITQTSTRKEYTLERAGRDVVVRSNPAGASVYLDGQDIEKVTNCVLPVVTFGSHKIKLVKENYGDWESDVEIVVGEGHFLVETALTPLNYKYVYKWGGPLRKIFVLPTGVAVDAENNVYVASIGGKKVQKLSPDWKFQTAWGQSGKEFKVLKSPGGIAIDSEGNIYVTDTKNHCVMKFDKTGKYKRRWGVEGTGNTMFNTPMGIAVDSNNDIYVVDYGNNCIKKFSSTGQLKKMWGKRGNQDGDFYLPTGIAVNKNNEVFVTERSRVQKFSSEGEFISSFGEFGSTDGAFKKPMGIYVDKDNFIYIADSENNRIQKFDKNGKFIAKWGSTGTANGQMVYPSGIVVDNRGYVYIVERDNNRLQLFGVSSPPESKSESK